MLRGRRSPSPSHSEGTPCSAHAPGPKSVGKELAPDVGGWHRWLHGWSLPLPDDLAAWAKLPRAEQLRTAGRLSAAHAPLLPRIAYCFHAARLAAFLLAWLCLASAAGGAGSAGGFAKLAGWASRGQICH